MSNVLEGKTAIITGAGSGMGLAAARLFHQHGANIVLADFSGAQEKTAVELGERTVPIQADISKAADAKAMVDLAVSEFGGLDILCNIAGANAPMVQHHEALESDFDKMINVNLRGAFLTMKYAIPAMAQRGGGSIVNVASAAALMGTPLYGSYSAAKTGLLGLTRTIALEYAEQNIRANSICPGPPSGPPNDGGSSRGKPPRGSRLSDQYGALASRRNRRRNRGCCSFPGERPVFVHYGYRSPPHRRWTDRCITGRPTMSQKYLTRPKVSTFGNDPLKVRSTFAQFPSGVAVLAVEAGDEKHALVASSFMVGVSLEPCLVAVAVQKSSETWEQIKDAASLGGVSIFGKGQGHLTRKLAGKDRAARFEQVAIDVGGERGPSS